MLQIDDEPDILDIVVVALSLDPELDVPAVAIPCAWPRCRGEVAAPYPARRHDAGLLDGRATLTRLRKDPQTAGIPVFFMTARAQTRELDHFKSLGAAGVIVKPFDPMTLAASLRSQMQPANAEMTSSQHMALLRHVKDETRTLKQITLSTNTNNYDIDTLDILTVLNEL